MNILQIITSSKNWAGTEQYIFDLSKKLISLGHNVIFVIANDGNVVYPRFEQIGTVYLLPLKSKFDFYSIKALRKIIKNEQPDIIHTHQPKNIFHAYFAKLGSKHPVIVHTVHFWINPTSPKVLYNWIFSKANYIIAVSEFVRLRVLDVYNSINAERAVTVLSSIEISRLGFNSIERVQQEVTIGYAGRLVEEKGIETLIKAINILHKKNLNFKLIIAGTGDSIYVEKLKQYISDFNLEDRVEFKGFIHNIGEYISLVDIAVVPSIVPEAISLMLLEYMALGKAIVSTNNGGQKEAIDNGINGILVNPSDEIVLSENLYHLLSNKYLRDSLGAAAKEKFETVLSYSNFMNKMLQVYEQARTSSDEE